jgi:hypothetical protein
MLVPKSDDSLAVCNARAITVKTPQQIATHPIHLTGKLAKKNNGRVWQNSVENQCYCNDMKREQNNKNGAHKLRDS